MKKVLVIDDEIGTRESLRILLKNSYEVFCVDSGQDGIKSVGEMRPDIVFLDIRMPDMTGIETLRKIREIDGNVSIIMLTGYGTLETAQEALRLGANDYLKKPFDVVEIRQVVSHHTIKTGANRDRMQSIGQLALLNRRLEDELKNKEPLVSLGQASREFVHDLLSPLTAAFGYVQLLLRKLTDSENFSKRSLTETISILDKIESAMKSCREMSLNWKDLGKENLLPMEKASIAEILRNVVSAVELLANKNGAELKLLVGSGDALILAHPDQIFRALQNVVINAIQALKGNRGLVSIDCRLEHPSQITIRVRDNGCGMTREQILQAFKPHFTTKSAEGGSGLGLCIAKKVIELHKGSIQIESSPGEGTIVSIQLPLFKDPPCKESFQLHLVGLGGT